MSNELAKLSKTDLVKQAGVMRNRALKFKKNAESTAEKLVFAGAGAAGAFGLGFLMGGKERDYQQLVTEKGLEEADKADPRLIGGLVPWDLGIGGALWVVGMTGLAGKKASPVIEAMGFGGLAGYVYNMGSEMALEAGVEEAAA